MRISKWLGATGAIVALGAAGFIAVPAASAGPITITASGASHVHCDISGTSKLSPTLVNNWLQAAHSGSNADPGDTGAAPAPVVSKDALTYTGNATIIAAMASIPNTTYAAAAPNTTSAKATSLSCTPASSVTDGTNTAPVTGASLTSVGVYNASDGTCAGLSTAPGVEQFTTIIKWTSGNTDKIAPTTAVATLSSLIDVGNTGVGFELTNSGSGITGYVLRRQQRLEALHRWHDPERDRRRSVDLGRAEREHLRGDRVRQAHSGRGRRERRRRDQAEEAQGFEGDHDRHRREPGPRVRTEPGELEHRLQRLRLVSSGRRSRITCEEPALRGGLLRVQMSDA